jgi:hypothetical protein
VGYGVCTTCRSRIITISSGSKQAGAAASTADKSGKEVWHKPPKWQEMPQTLMNTLVDFYFLHLWYLGRVCIGGVCGENDTEK